MFSIRALFNLKIFQKNKNVRKMLQQQQQQQAQQLDNPLTSHCIDEPEVLDSFVLIDSNSTIKIVLV